MKKILSLLVLTLVLVGCGSKTAEKTDYLEVYRTSYTDFATDVNKAVDMSISVQFPKLSSLAETTLLLPDGKMSIDMKVISNATDPTALQGHFKTSLGAMVVEMYALDGYSYIEMFGMKVKSKLEAGDTAQFNTDAYTNSLIDDDSLLQKFETTEKDGDISYVLALNSKEEIVAFLEESGDGSPIGSLETDEYEFTSFKYSVIINKATNDIKNISMEMGLKEIATSETGSLVYNIVINGLGDQVKINFPDFSDYIEQ